MTADHTIILSRATHASSDRVLTETLVARVGLGLIALHVADDNFLQPQPGTGASDHLVSGFVPLMLLTATAVSYPRLRAGVRATLVLLAGYFAVLTGIEAAYYTLNGGPSGDDVTGILAMLAAPVLLTLGTEMLWRSRR